MPFLRITSTQDGPRLHGASAALVPVLRHALACDPGPVIVMVHGYKYDPGHPNHCPHRTILSPAPSGKGGRLLSWPRHLGLRGQHGEGLGLSFGWPARGSLWQAHRRASLAGAHLAQLCRSIRHLDPTRPIHVIAHSLGARVTLAALAAQGPIDRAIVLAAAEYHSTARAALATPMGQCAQVLNVTSRENDVFDFMIERLIAAPSPGDRMLGHGTATPANMLTLQLDDTHSLSRLRRAGFPIGDPSRRICHWSPYLRPGVFPLYRAVLNGEMALSRLRALLPDQTAPRWSRLRPGMMRRAPAQLPAKGLRL